jgi:hypothetical protein
MYDNRLNAKKEGNTGLSFVYKILMNSLYGRFGINPKSSITEICNENRYKELMNFEGEAVGNYLGNNRFLCASLVNTIQSDEWAVPRNAAVQISAAITANARIHMYPYISRDDCYYTDTDSVVLQNPLPARSGKFKLEYEVKEGIFIAAKSYWIEPG